MTVHAYKKEVEQELENILRYWMQLARDPVHGGFYGAIDNSNTPDTTAPKGAVLYSRILWTFSAAHNLTAEQKYLDTARYAASCLLDSLADPVYGGVYWTASATGQPEDTKKQIYAQAFALYAWSEYFLASGREEAKSKAVELYKLIVQHSYDPVHGGYIEALTRDWQQTDNLRLSAKDANEKKSMNTHLHVLEAFANLYCIWPDATLKSRIKELLRIFLDHIIDRQTGHLILFFDDNWNVRSNIHSYGHDIEAAWLLQEAAHVIEHRELEQEVKEISLLITEAALEGMDTDGGLWYEYDADTRHLIREKHWWPQAEAMVGFYNTYRNTGNEKYLQYSMNSWQFIRQHLLDLQNGEWFWGIREDGTVMQEDKAGLWKCPYHNGRACMELIKRLQYQ